MREIERWREWWERGREGVEEGGWSRLGDTDGVRGTNWQNNDEGA